MAVFAQGAISGGCLSICLSAWLIVSHTLLAFCQFEFLSRHFLCLVLSPDAEKDTDGRGPNDGVIPVTFASINHSSNTFKRDISAYHL